MGDNSKKLKNKNTNHSHPENIPQKKKTDFFSENNIDTSAASLIEQTILKKSINPVMVIDNNGNYLDCNNAALDFLEITYSQLKTKNVKDFATQKLTEEAIKEHKKLWHQGGTIETEYLINGKIKILELSIIPVKLNKKPVIFGIGKDITAQRHFEKQLIQSEEKLNELNKSLKAKNDELQSLLYIASHDLRTPLVNIQGFSGELKKSCQNLEKTIKKDLKSLPSQNKEIIKTILNHEIKEELSFITSATSSMQMLLDGLLKVSRIAKKSLNIETLDVNQIIDSILKTLNYQIEQKQIEIKKQDLPPCIGDHTQINQVFTNLISNSIKYLDPQKKPEISITASSDHKYSTYCVTDNGIGINPKDHKKIFEIFHRLHSPSKIPGLGLGLTIVKRIVEKHNGKIKVISTPQKQTSFYISLPNKTFNHFTE